MSAFSLEPWAAIWPAKTMEVAMPFGIKEETILAPGPVLYDTTVAVAGSPVLISELSSKSFFHFFEG